MFYGEVLTEIFFATDIHGSERAFRKFANAAKFYGVHALILGGDVTGKLVIPIVSQPDNSYSVEFLGAAYVLKTEEEIQSIEKSISDSGYYPYRITSDELERLSKEDIDQIFLKLIKERLASWMKLIEERLAGTGIQVYITGGNDDPLEIEEVLNSSTSVINAQDKVCKIDEYHELVSSGLSNPTPWKTQREVSEEKLAESIEAMVSKVHDVKNAIFNLHAPPRDSQLDACPLLDDSVHPPKPVVKGGAIVTYGAGSSSVRASIEKYQPLLGLFGHIHESRGVVRIGRTLCINPGSEYQEGILRGATINLDKDKVKNYQLISG
jgi:Icc-related predicted phosphoesterase